MKNKKGVKGYLCGIDWQHELAKAPDGVRIYPKIKDVEHFQKCVQSGCGVVQVEVHFKRWARKQDIWFRDLSKKRLK